MSGELAKAIEYRILGPLEIADSGRLLSVTAPRERQLLLCLLVGVNETIPVDLLAERLWRGRPPRSALKLVQHYVSRLRRALGEEAIETLPPGYRLVVTPEALDSVRFESLVDEARDAAAAGNHALASALSRRALALWRGPAFVDVVYEEFARAEAGRLEALRLDCLEGAFAAELELGAHGTLLPELAAACDAHPLRERLRGLLMLALYRAGRHAEALAVYRDARRALREELGLEPGRELRTLERAILSHDPSLAPPPLSARQTVQLPVPPTPLVGRERELDLLGSVIVKPGARLVTLTGAAGSGKTRLALELARRRQGSFANGARLVELGSVRDPALVLSAIAQALELVEHPGEPLSATLAAALADSELLLVVDNMEHLVPAAADLARLASRCPRLTLVVTSRRVLHVTGEQVFPVEPLPEADAVALFAACAAAADPTFEPAPDLEPVLYEICRRLDSLPLAIELAAARIRTLDPGQLLERLKSRLSLLTAGPRDLPARQQTLRDTIDWSVELLTASERRLLARLGVFVGSFTLEAAEAICAEGDSGLLDDLGALVDLSLLQPVPSSERRFRLFETVREYGLEQLDPDQASALRDRHTRYYLRLAEQRSSAFEAGGTLEALALLDEDLGNLRAATAALRDAGGNDELQLAAALWRYWWLRGLISEGRSALDAALERSRAPTGIRARALRGAAILALRQGDQEAARHHGEESARTYRQLGDSLGLAQALMALGSIAVAEHDTGTGERRYRESAALLPEHGAERDRAVLLLNMGDLALNRGDFAAAERLATESLEYFYERADDSGIAANLSNKAFALLEQGRYDEAHALLVESARRAHGLGFREWLASALLGLAACEAATSDPARAAELLGAAERTRQDAGASLPPFEYALGRRTSRQLRAALSGETYAARLEAGQSMEVRELVDRGQA